VVEQFTKGIVSPHIIVADLAHYDVQQLLKESALMITDYSSVLFDFVYMKKPALFFQFDREEFLGRHVQEGYVNESAFGPVVEDVESLIEELSKYLKEGLCLDSQYETVIDSFFPMRDTHNCERVYDAVMNC
jgi:CDP-glycerol glycerophosphotransferase (TagB/SpsB family)